MKNRKIFPSIIFLVIANSIPLIGVLFFDWSLLQILLLYWFESAVIGFYNIFKLIKIGGLLSFIYVPFFIFHYGGFMFGHIAFIFALFGKEFISSMLLPNPNTLKYLLLKNALAVIMLFISHGLSFFYNFLGKHEYKNTDLGKQMMAPYKRIVAMHITILLGGFFILIYRAPAFTLIILIVAKIITDLYAHYKEHDIQNSADFTPGLPSFLQPHTGKTHSKIQD